MVVFLSSCEVLQLVDTNQYIQGTCSLVLINWKNAHIKVQVDDSEIAIKPSGRFKLELPEGEHEIVFNGKVSTFKGRNQVTYKKILK